MKGTEINKASDRQMKSEAKRILPRDLMVGLERLQEKKYLKQRANEKPVTFAGRVIDPYQNRVDESRLNNMFSEAVEDAAGRAFAKPAVPMEETPQELQDFMLDVDGRGSNFQVFGKEVAETAVAEGCDYVLVDHPTRPAGQMTAEQEKALRLAPFWRRYSSASVLDWKIVLLGRESRLFYLKLRECPEEEIQVREIFAGNPDLPEKDDARWSTYRVWRPDDPEKKEGEWSVVEEGMLKPQVEIPFVEFATDLAAPFCASPPFLDLAHLTIAHYRKTSSLDNIHNFACFPVRYAAGFAKEDFEKTIADGPENFYISALEGAKIAFAEPTCESVADVRLELDKMEALGKAMSSQPLVTEASADITATSAILRASASVSRLESWVLGFEDGFSGLFRYTAIYLGIVAPEDLKGWGGVVLNRQFIPTARNVEGARVALEAAMMGKLSDETLHEVFVAAEIVPESVTFEEERKRLEEQGPTEPTPADKAAAAVNDLTQEKVAA